jgi:uncharacterized protein YdeI (YjbR/CyaY-like superfamily)
MAEVIFFKNTKELCKWFEKNHDKLTEQWFGYYKKGSGKTGVTYFEAVDEALCFGWIDGLTKGINDKCYKQRFTPRKKGSTWSAVNIKKVKGLIKSGRMHEAGLTVFKNRDKVKTNQYSFEQKEIKLTPKMEKMFKFNKKAWEFYSKSPPGYRRTSAWLVISAKRDETKLKRLERLIADSEAGLRIKELRRV